MPVMAIYTTCPTRNEALSLARTLLEERRVACVNLFSPHSAIYRWEGAVQETEEYALLVKTSEEAVDTVMERMRALHPYDCPAIVAWRANRANRDFERWVETEVKI